MTDNITKAIKLPLKDYEGRDVYMEEPEGHRHRFISTGDDIIITFDKDKDDTSEADNNNWPAYKLVPYPDWMEE